jgi:hypothetical protein
VSVPPPVGALHRLEVEYYRRMKPQRVYTLKVRAEKAPSLGGSNVPPPEGAIVYRPIIPGAIVTPTEHAVSLSNPGETVTFFITPIAFGELPESRIEYSLPGQPGHRLMLPMRGVSHAWTARLLFLLLVLPAILFVVRGARTWATPPEDPKGIGGLTERLRMWIPDGVPLRETMTSIGQGVMDYLVLNGGAIRLSFLLMVILGLSLVISLVRNSVRRGRKSSDGFSLQPIGNVGSNPRTLPPFLEPVDLESD